MKGFLSDFLKVLSNSILIIALAFTSFLLIINIYHYKEVSYKYEVNTSESDKYQNYKKMLAEIDKKMNSIDVSGSQYGSSAKPIYEYYKGCMKIFDDDSFNNLKNGSLVNTIDIYNANNKILNDYNNTCLFSIPYSISVMPSDYSSFDEVRKLTEEKRKIVISNALYLTKATMGNSAYSFATNNFKGSVYDEVGSWYDLTLNNYTLMASILDDIADWYILEFGGNR